MKEETAELVLRKCMGHKSKEVVLIVTDNELYRLAIIFYEKALKMGIETVFMCMSPRDMDGQEPPGPIARAMTHADIALLITNKSLSHTNARRQACQQYGVRIASMPGANPARIEHVLNVDYARMAMSGEQIAYQLRNANEVLIATDAGTKLRMKITGRYPMVDTGLFIFPGAFGNLPAGEVCLAPLEGTAEGTLVVDGSMAGVGTLTEPIVIQVKNGFAVDISSEELRNMLKPFGQDGLNIAEFGIGINPNADVTGNVLEDEKATETVHIALGDNMSFGGKVSVPCHLDGVIRKPRIFLDGVEVPPSLLWEKKCAFQPAEKMIESGIILSSTTPEATVTVQTIYEVLFESSNEALYVLDFDSQRFLEANTAFCRLTGYNREEVLSTLLAAHLVSQQNMSKFEQKRETRKIRGTERYSLKLLCKNGDIRPAEFSVRKINLNGRDLIIGAISDRTEQVHMEQNLHAQVTESGLASARIHSLTEKLKNVPVLSRRLLLAEDEKDVFEETLTALCDRTKLACSEATFYIFEGDSLVPRYSSSTRKPRKIDLADDNKISNALRGTANVVVEDLRVTVPLRGRQAHIGVLDIQLDPIHIKQMKDNEPAQKSYIDILTTLGEMIALIVDSLRLYNTVKVQSVTDSLTQVYNRRYFEQKLSEEFQRATRYHRDLALLIIDLNYLKQLNDTYGHQQGDHALCVVADMLRANLRGVDIICRWGGDEFAVIMPETSLETAITKANTLLSRIKEKPYPVLNNPAQKLTYSITIGVSAAGAEVLTEKQMMNAADEALYEAKRMGRDRVHAHKEA
jgi:diguanylate cyclase (GGDEF)-like protein/PAS domain S-box-containing protein